MFSLLERFKQSDIGIFGPVLEIIIISAFFYVFITFMRGTRGAGIAKGLAIAYGAAFIVLLAVTQWLGLENVSWLLENMVSVSLIAMIVIFQPEIRHGLLKLWETVRVWNARESSIEKELADAAVTISRNNSVGALIVIEREVQIGSYIESGIQLDALCSSQLLRTIFTKNTPLHDGAVIIRQGRLIAANCLLPLSENIETCRGMGTRHRAAIGLSEESDAVTIVVSEETGRISVTLHGQIIRDLDYEGLRSFLRENCSDDDSTLKVDSLTDQ